MDAGWPTPPLAADGVPADAARRRAALASHPAAARRRQIGLVSAWLAGLLAMGTIGFVYLEGLTTIDAVFLTVNTISTLGYGSIEPLTPQGRIFTVLLIATGVGTLFYLLSAVTALVVEGGLRDYFGRRTMMDWIEELSDHVVLCGYGRFGGVVADELLAAGAQVVVIDADPAREDDLTRLGAPYLIGNALSDEPLLLAGIERARAIVVATPKDADNVFITLSAREKNPQIRIHARGETAAGLRRLRLAGADQVVSAYQIGGMRVASSILRPAVTDFLELAGVGRGEEVDLEQVVVGAGSAIVGRRVGDLENELPRLRIVAQKRGDDPIRMIPAPDVPVSAGDHLVVIGERPSLERLALLATASG